MSAPCSTVVKSRSPWTSSTGQRTPASCSSVQPAKKPSWNPLSRTMNSSKRSGWGESRSYSVRIAAKSSAVGMIVEVAYVEGSPRSGCRPSGRTLAETATTASTRSGWCTASSRATPPPMLCPMTAARSWPRWSSTATTSAAWLCVRDVTVGVGGPAVALQLDAHHRAGLGQPGQQRAEVEVDRQHPPVQEHERHARPVGLDVQVLAVDVDVPGGGRGQGAGGRRGAGRGGAHAALTSAGPPNHRSRTVGGAYGEPGASAPRGPAATTAGTPGPREPP